MFYLIAMLISMSPMNQNEVFETDHYLINNTNETITVSVDLKDQSNNPAQGSELFQIPPGSAMIISQDSNNNGFTEPTAEYTYTVMGGAVNLDLNDAASWVFEKVSDHKARYQCVIEQD